MNWILSLVLLLIHNNFLLFVQNEEIRDFSFSKVLIKDDGDVTVTKNDDKVSFFIVGDWGGMPYFPYRTIIEQKTADRMEKLSKTYNTIFQLTLGDNFYFEGVTDVNDKRFKETYEDVFNTAYLRETPWFALLGNHDHRGNASAQVEYTKKSKTWIMPSFNYTIDVKINDGNETLISIMMIDTILMCGNTHYSGVGQPRLRTNKAKKQARNYLSDFEKRLAAVAATNVPYIMVAGHFPVWSVGETGPVKCLVDQLRPLLNKYGVTAYLCGHDHSLQHLRDDYLNCTVDHIISGGANTIDDDTPHTGDVPPGSFKYYWGDKSEFLTGGFVVAQATRQNITLTFLETNGKDLYQTVVYPRRLK